jgi:hypothetical protein
MRFLRRDESGFVAPCFAKSEDAEAFAERFGGKRLPSVERKPSGWGDPKAAPRLPLS